MNKLQGCRVIEGQLSIVLMEKATVASFENISFPELREVTDFIKIYRAKGIRNLGDIFPNLTVVRGMQLYKDYALVVYDSAHLESLGLRSLTKIERGAVRIQLNDRLCYTDTIDWSAIVSENDLPNNKIKSNYDSRLCGLCPNASSRTIGNKQILEQCPADSAHRLLCWDDKHCQTVCRECDPHGCTPSGQCCHRLCLGGCSGNTSSDCYVCKHYSIDDGPDRKCVQDCPKNFYKLARRCVTEQACRSMPAPPPGSSDPALQRTAPTINAYKIFNDTCVYMCPSGYMEKGNASDARCVRCPHDRCNRECTGAKIDSVAAAEQFRGCTHVRGVLEIAVRATGGNTMVALESSLGEIREIEGCLKVTRSYTLISLMFLKNLRVIKAIPHENKGEALHILNNPNLEILWDWATYGKIYITGTFYIHSNPKLCTQQIAPLAEMRHPYSNFTYMEVSQSNGGDLCSPKTLQLQVHKIGRDFVILQWDRYCVSDIRKLLGYSIYYIPTKKNVTLYEQRDACSDYWNVIDVTIDEARGHNETAADAQDPLIDMCKENQPHFKMISPLTPFTRYAAYVKTYTTQQDGNGAQSPIVYLTTLPGHPSPPGGLTAKSNGPHSVMIKWAPPSMPNGTIMLYHVKIQANSYNRPKILAWRNNYCGNPSALANIIAGTGEVPEQEEARPTGEVKNESCSCRDEPRAGTRFNTGADEERVETINFENDLQNEVYVKSGASERIRNRGETSGNVRARRSVDMTLNSMLVILSENRDPEIGKNYTNATDRNGYVQSLYYELPSNTTSLTVTDMRHFTWYTVNVWACRNKYDSEKDDEFATYWCSKRAFYTFRTNELPDVDVVRHLQAELLPSNKTLPEVNVTWEPPQNPNGFVVAYNVHYTRVEDMNTDQQDVGLQTCVMADDYESNGRAYMMRNLLAGNYSIRITPITVSGLGKISEIFLYIPERQASGGYGWVWGLAGGCLAVLLAAAAGTWYARRSLLSSTEINKLFASVNPEYVSTVYVPDEWEVPRANIHFVREIGQGSFGMVYEGIAKNIEKGKPETRCAVKTVNEHATDRERIEFLNEASVMKAFDTSHVVRLLGVVSRGQPTLVVMELMEGGDLKTYLRSHRPDPDGSLPSKGTGGNPPTLQNILQMAIEIADGMAYLSAKKFVHRDLAARNCMVAGDLTVKVGDFGMTRDIYETDYYRKGTKGLLPVRWMSPESLKDGVFFK
uniref:Tyrosine-protein kinase receptor n=1 Tax=Maruca vitrata TaxID=497515 RepID=A0A2D3E1C8_MARVT|nr:insulin receptor [Maruca vitrata]